MPLPDRRPSFTEAGEQRNHPSDRQIERSRDAQTEQIVGEESWRCAVLEEAEVPVRQLSYEALGVRLLFLWKALLVMCV